MNITVTLYCEEELEKLSMDVNDVDAFVELVNKFGYEDKDGNDYKLASANVEPFGGFFIYLELVDVP